MEISDRTESVLARLDDKGKLLVHVLLCFLGSSAAHDLLKQWVNSLPFAYFLLFNI
jgi:hypothetical protein